MLQIDLQTLFEKHQTYDASYKKRLKSYKETYPKFNYDSPSTILEDSFNISNFNQYDACPSGEDQEVQSSPHVELTEGDLIEVVDEQTITQSKKQVPA